MPKENCDVCNGTGLLTTDFIDDYSACMNCNGKGNIEVKHVWVNKYEECDQCNYGTHRCIMCGEDLDHESYDAQGNLHDVAFCRPDLVEHEPGPLCTWSHHSPMQCYWDHVNNKLSDHGMIEVIINEPPC